MSRPLTKDEWRKALAEDWSKAIQATYEAEIKAAVKAEREACIRACRKVRDSGYLLKHQKMVADECMDAIRARGETK